MSDMQSFCMQCMNKLGEGETVCPNCGCSGPCSQDSLYLPQGTVLFERYLVGKMIKRTIDSAVYIGFDKNADKVIEIREFLPTGICSRAEDGLTLEPSQERQPIYDEYCRSFAQLWRNLMRFRGLPAIFDVNDVAEFNGTVYAFTDHNDCTTFAKILRNMDIESRPLTLKKVKDLIVPMLSTIESLHTANVVHRGLSPETLVLGSDGKLKITGFAIPQVRTTKNKVMCSVCDGYSAIEQYGFNWQQGSWTDIYSMGAIIYKLLTGRTVKAAPLRLGDDEIEFTAEELSRIPQSVTELIRKCLAVMPQDRIKNISEIRTVFLPFETTAKNVTRLSSPAREIRNVRVMAGDTLTPVQQPKEPTVIVKPRQAVLKRSGNQNVVVSEKERLEKIKKKQAEQAEILEKQREAERQRVLWAQQERERHLAEQVRKKEEKRAKAKSKKENSKIAIFAAKIKKAQNENPAVLGLFIAVAVVVGCSLVSLTLYGTVLFRVFDAPILDNCLSAFSFLPINKQDNSEQINLIETPDFSGFTREYIESNDAFMKKYNISFAEDYCSTTKAGYAFDQSIKPGEQVPKGSSITVYISKGIEMIKFPDVTGQNYNEAYNTLTNMGFDVTAEYTFNGGLHTADTVKSASLNVGEEYPRDTQVVLTVWNKPLEITTRPAAENDETTSAQGEEKYGFDWFSILERIFG